MTMTDSVLTHAPALQGWLRAARKWLAPNRSMGRPVNERGDCVPQQAPAESTIRMSAPQSPTLQGEVKPDSSDGRAVALITPEDWDLLFRAALELLSRLAVEKTAPVSTGVRLQAPGTALRECMDALDHLRQTAPPTQHPQMTGQAQTEGDITAHAPARPSGADR